MSEERKRILEMLKKGKITIEEAEELLGALEEENSFAEVPQKKVKKALRVIISENNEEKVNITFPLGLARGLLKFIPASAREKLAEEDIDLKQLVSSIDELEAAEELVRIEDGGDKVIVRVE